MGNVDWNSLEGKYYRVDVGSTTADALGSGDNSVIYYTTDGNVVLNGQVFGGGCLDLGLVSSDAVGDAEAAKSEVAGNRQITMIRFRVQGVTSERVTVIWQWCNGVNESAQLKFVDKSVWRRNVTGANGVAGAPTNAFQWERTWAHYLGYDASTRKIQLKDYNQTAFKDVELPLATESQAGLMSAADKAKLNGKSVVFNYDGAFNVGETIPVSQFLNRTEARASILENQDIYVKSNFSLSSTLQHHTDKFVIWRDYNENNGITFSFAFFDGTAIVKKVLTLNSAQDAWTVTA